MSKERGIFRMIFNNFINSLRPRPIRGNLVGKDKFGNKYLEIPADRSVGRRKASRWFEPAEKEDFQQPDMPAEWESWLRGRREQPPTEEEILKNYAVAELKKKNAAELEQKEPTGTAKPIKEGTQPFPTYEEFENFPGKQNPRKRQD